MSKATTVNKITTVAVVLAVMLISACSTPLLLDEADVPARLQQLISDQQYRRTLVVIDSIKPDSALFGQVQKLRREVVTSMESYDAEVVAKTSALSRQFQWQQADELFSDALPRLPETSRSHAAYEMFRDQRSQYIRDQELKLNILLAEHMLEEGEYRTNIRNAAPSSWSAGRALKNYQSRRRDVAEYLANQGLAALDDGDLGSAKKYLKLSQQLEPNDNVKLALGKINDELNARWSRHLRKRDQHYQTVVEQYNAALSKKELQKAQTLLQELIELNPKDNAGNGARREKLQVAVEQELKRAIARGETAYSDGNVKLALTVWKSAAKLAPDHPELLKHIDRAERFLENYESLK